MSTQVIPIVTAADGSFTTNVNCSGEVLAIGLVMGTLVSPHLTITDLDTGAPVFAKTDVLANSRWQPGAVIQTVAGADTADAAGPPETNANYARPVCFRQAHVAVANAGDSKRGTLFIAYR